MVYSRPIPYREATNRDPCGGAQNENNGCQQTFPRMQPGGGLCFMCLKLQDPSADRDIIRATFTQCGTCGVCGTMVTDPCGTCRRAENYESGVLDNERDQAAQRRHANLEAKMRRTPVDGVHRATGTTVPIQELQAIRTAQGIGSPSQQAAAYCTVYYECRRSDSTKHVDQMLGMGVISFPEINTMLALRSRIVKEVNGRWTEIYSAPLLEEETSLRAPNNYVFPADNLVMTIAHWYQTYSAAEYRDTFIVLPKNASRKGKTNTKPYAFSVELYINVGLYASRTEDPELVGTARAGAKRKMSSMHANQGRDPDSNPSQAISSPPSRKILRSSFVGDGDLFTQAPQALHVTEVLFKRTTCLITDDSGVPTLLEESSTIKGLLETKTLDLSVHERGRSKDVFNLHVDGKPYVAKKLVDIGRGALGVPISDAVKLLTADLVRLKRMGYFAAKFQSATFKHGIEIAAFDVSDGFLIKMYKAKSSPPPAPAGESESVGERPEEDVNESIEELTEIYIVEPMRLTSTVVKYSGTLGTTTRTDLRSSTMAAFAHFVAQETACQYVFADIQGSNNASQDGKLSLTLFDPMTHTLEKTSGLGDHGPAGIQDVISNHVCNHICLGLELASLQVLQDTLNDLLQETEDFLGGTNNTTSTGPLFSSSSAEEN